MSPLRALVFAAGRGERMRPLTDTLPKPLLRAGGKPLVAWHLERLASIGVREVVLNTSWLSDRFEPALGDGARWGLRLHYSYEGPAPLETGGGLLKALPLLGDAPFLVVNADTWTDADLAALPREPAGLAHLLMVPNPPQHPRGDFLLDGDGLLHDDGGLPHDDDGQRLTYSGIGMYRPGILDDWRAVIGDAPGSERDPPRFRLVPLLKAAMARGQVHGQLHTGRWIDVGTPERLAALDAELGGASDAPA
jgi:MurNAc alpha-1-phosphate uridylyltransferase